MKRLILTTLIAGVLLVPGADAAIKGRQANQKGRIRQGLTSGSLTGREAARLNSSWSNLNRSIRRDRIDGGGLTRRERVKIDRQQNRLNRQIFSQKHDRQVRPR